MADKTVYPVLPEKFTPGLIRLLTIKEALLVIGQYGLLQVAERIGFDEFVTVMKQDTEPNRI